VTWASLERLHFGLDVGRKNSDVVFFCVIEPRQLEPYESLRKAAAELLQSKSLLRNDICQRRMRRIQSPQLRPRRIIRMPVTRANTMPMANFSGLLSVGNHALRPQCDAGGMK
jgi:hypothetical protein